MDDPLKARLDRIRKFSESANRRASLYGDVAKVGGGDAARSLGALQRAPAPGKKLQKIGFLMLWVPEPTGVTCAVGGPMIVAGRYLEKKYNSSTIGDVGSEARAAASSMRDFKDAVM